MSVSPQRGEASRQKSKKWSPQEVEQLVAAINASGCAADTLNWGDISRCVPGRTSKQCREKYKNDLRPDLSKEPWSGKEEFILCRMHSEVGNQWAEVSRYLPGRSENTIKNKWNATLRLKASPKHYTLLWTYAHMVTERGRVTDYDTFQRALADYGRCKGSEALEELKVPESYFQALRESGGRAAPPTTAGAAAALPKQPRQAPRQKSQKPTAAQGAQPRRQQRKRVRNTDDSDEYDSEAMEWSDSEVEVPSQRAPSKQRRSQPSSSRRTTSTTAPPITHTAHAAHATASAASAAGLSLSSQCVGGSAPPASPSPPAAAHKHANNRSKRGTGADTRAHLMPAPLPATTPPLSTSMPPAACAHAHAHTHAQQQQSQQQQLSQGSLHATAAGAPHTHAQPNALPGLPPSLLPPFFDITNFLHQEPPSATIRLCAPKQQAAAPHATKDAHAGGVSDALAPQAHAHAAPAALSECHPAGALTHTQDQNQPPPLLLNGLASSPHTHTHTHAHAHTQQQCPQGSVNQDQQQQQQQQPQLQQLAHSPLVPPALLQPPTGPLSAWAQQQVLSFTTPGPKTKLQGHPHSSMSTASLCLSTPAHGSCQTAQGQLPAHTPFLSPMQPQEPDYLAYLRDINVDPLYTSPAPTTHLLQLTGGSSARRDSSFGIASSCGGGSTCKSLSLFGGSNRRDSFPLSGPPTRRDSLLFSAAPLPSGSAAGPGNGRNESLGRPSWLSQRPPGSVSDLQQLAEPATISTQPTLAQPTQQQQHTQLQARPFSPQQQEVEEQLTHTQTTTQLPAPAPLHIPPPAPAEAHNHPQQQQQQQQTQTQPQQVPAPVPPHTLPPPPFDLQPFLHAMQCCVNSSAPPCSSPSLVRPTPIHASTTRNTLPTIHPHLPTSPSATLTATLTPHKATHPTPTYPTTPQHTLPTIYNPTIYNPTIPPPASQSATLTPPKTAAPVAAALPSLHCAPAPSSSAAAALQREEGGAASPASTFLNGCLL